MSWLAASSGFSNYPCTSATSFWQQQSSPLDLLLSEAGSWGLPLEAASQDMSVETSLCVIVMYEV
jgi:hypothetical protein